MQKIIKSLHENISPVRLYLDDIEQIVEILSSVNKTVEIYTNEYAFNNLKQFSETKSEIINELHISIRDPYLSLDLEQSSITLYINKNEPVARGLFEQVKQVLLRRKRPLTWILHNAFLVGILFWSSFYVLLTGIKQESLSIFIIGIIAIISSIVLGIYGYQDKFRRYTIIIPKYKKDNPTFFKRNKDEIILSIISAIAGGLITLLIAKLTGLFK